jgi:hypothetical protein
VSDGVGDRSLEHYSFGLEASQVHSHDLARLEHHLKPKTILRCRRSKASQDTTLPETALTLLICARIQPTAPEVLWLDEDPEVKREKRQNLILSLVLAILAVLALIWVLYGGLAPFGPGAISLPLASWFHRIVSGL